MTYSTIPEKYSNKPRMLQQILDPHSINGDYECMPSTNAAVVHTKVNEVTGINYGTTFLDEVISNNTGDPRSIIIEEPSCFEDSFSTSGSSVTIPTTGGTSEPLASQQNIEIEASDNSSPIWSEYSAEFIYKLNALFPLLSLKAAPGRFIYQFGSSTGGTGLPVGSVLNVILSGHPNGTVYCEVGIYDQISGSWTIYNNNSSPLGFVGNNFNVQSVVPCGVVGKNIGGIYIRVRSNVAQALQLKIDLVTTAFGAANLLMMPTYLNCNVDANSQLAKWDVSKMAKIAWSILCSNTAAYTQQEGNIYVARGNGGTTAAQIGLTPEQITQLNAFIYNGPAKEGGYCCGMTRFINYIPHLRRLKIREDPIIILIESKLRNPFMVTRSKIYQGFSNNTHYPKIFPASDPLMPEVINLARGVPIPCENPEHTDIIKEAVTKGFKLLTNPKFLQLLATGGDISKMWFPRIGSAVSLVADTLNQLAKAQRKDIQENKPVVGISPVALEQLASTLTKKVVQKEKEKPQVAAATGKPAGIRKRNRRGNRGRRRGPQKQN